MEFVLNNKREDSSEITVPAVSIYLDIPYIDKEQIHLWSIVLFSML